MKSPPNGPRPRIVVLDSDPAFGSNLAPESARGALSTAGLEELGAVVLHPNTSADEVIQRLAGATVAVTNKVVLGRDVLERLPELRLVTVLATGFNVVDVVAARELGITVTNVPGYSTASTAQFTFALLLELCHHVGEHAGDVRAGGWAEAPVFSYWRYPLVELEGLTLGIVGYGAIGQRVAKIAAAFGMNVLVHTRTPKSDAPVRFTSKEELLEMSDVVTLHVPLTPETKHFIDGAALLAMKRSAFLLNVARGPIVDEVALVHALEARTIAGAALDVLSLEPPEPNHALARSPFAIVTPHIAWATEAARQRLVETTQRNIEAFLLGRPENVVS